ncbi:hypothetical protein [Lyticum sinuosum]|uniref:Uncharacterized protein n=1 Tax=Lyticum sinuosum TaxID=1332059 RepID=A0AAE5AHQ5_9RICK|nr:hypothetical protein [Lyticum sinuosum]MDZ5761403.1 hypothetical protein [Lyticum sinuosum]
MTRQLKKINSIDAFKLKKNLSIISPVNDNFFHEQKESIVLNKNHLNDPRLSKDKRNSIIEKSNVRALWRSVITQALMDAASNSHKKSEKINKIYALKWLKGNNTEFISVCQMADLDPKYVKIKVESALSRGCKWRNDIRRSGESISFSDTSIHNLERQSIVKKRDNIKKINDNSFSKVTKIIKKTIKPRVLNNTYKSKDYKYNNSNYNNIDFKINKKKALI